VALRRLQAIVMGRVQGVSFRYYTAEEARSIGVTGWVRNLEDRTVEVTAEGTQEQLNKLLNFLHRGSPAARVIEVRARWSSGTGEFKSFTIQ
jgi:acylphosphatase